MKKGVLYMRHLWIIMLLCSVAMAEGPVYPNKELTPGTTMQAELEDLCEPGYTKVVRRVTVSMKKKVFKLYGIDWEKREEYEVDHFINLGIGGNNDISNLWPMPYEPRPGAREKDVAENYLRRMVCNDEMSIDVAQEMMRSDWYKVYQMRKNKGGND